MLHPVQLIGELWKLLLVFLELGFPCRSCVGAALSHSVLELVIDSIGNKKFRIFRPSVIFLHKFDFGFAQRLASRLKSFGSVTCVPFRACPFERVIASSLKDHSAGASSVTRLLS